MESPGMIWRADGYEVAITREAMDMLAGAPGMAEEDFGGRFADDIRDIAELAELVDRRDAAGRVLITANRVGKMRPWLVKGDVAADVDAWGHQA